jgi:hypothetical protein
MASCRSITASAATRTDDDPAELDDDAPTEVARGTNDAAVPVPGCCLPTSDGLLRGGDQDGLHDSSLANLSRLRCFLFFYFPSS